MSNALKLSHSSISEYSDCPLKWKLHRIDRLPEKPKHYFSFGKAIHSALEFMYAGDSCPPLDAVMDAFFEGWSGAGYKDKDAASKGQRDGASMLTAYYAKYGGKAWAKPLAAEASFDMEVDHVRVIGYIDRIDVLEDGTLHVLDYKTGKELEAERIETDEQMTMYQIAAEAKFPGAAVSKVSLFHVPTLAWATVPARGAELVAALKEKIKRTADAIRRQEFEPKPSEKACKWCDYKPHCKAWRP